MTPPDTAAPTNSRPRAGRIEVRSERTPWRGDLIVTVECRPTPTGLESNSHEITIHDDWSVATPHDLDAERVAMAFGGYSSCVVLVDMVLPLLSPLLPQVARHLRPALQRHDREKWLMPVGQSAVCCHRGHKSFSSARTAFEHAVSASHLANRLGLPIWLIEPIIREVAATSRPNLDHFSHLERRVRDVGGIEHLWRAGIRPDEIEQMALWAAAVDEALPVSYFEGIAYSGHDPQWIPAVLQYRPDADTAAWLAWSPSPGPFVSASEWGAWLGLGLSRKEFWIAVESRLPLTLVPEVAAATGWSSSRSARMLVAWSNSACNPTPSQLAELARSGADQHVPSQTAVDAARAEAREVGAVIERTEIGVMLALAGNRPLLLDAVRKGVRSLTEFIEYREGRWIA